MKRLIAAGVLLAISVAICFFGDYVVKDTAKEMKAIVKECRDEYHSNKEKTIELSKEIEKKWDKREVLLSLFVNHSLIDEVESAIAEIKPYADTDNYSNFDTACEKVLTLIHQMLEDNRVSAHSIL